DVTDDQVTDEKWDPEDRTSDDTLQLFQALAHRGISTQVTLTVGGFLVAGRITSGELFNEGLAAQVDSLQSDTEIVGTIAKALRAIGERYTAAYADSDDDDDDPYEGLDLTRLRLQDVKILAPGSPAITAPFWRGRLDASHGWTLGALEMG